MAFVSDPMDRPPEPRPWTADDYLKAAEAGVFAPDERLELIDGAIVLMSPQGVRHASSVTKFTRWLAKALPANLDFLVQATARVSVRNVPEPDVAVIRKPVDELTNYAEGSDLLLVVEVSETTLSTDRNRKARIYAEAGVPEYWIVNLNARAIEAHREPTADGYRLIQRFGEHEQIKPAFLDSQIEVAQLLPRER